MSCKILNPYGRAVGILLSRCETFIMAKLKSSLFVLNKLKRLPKREPKMENPVKLAIQRTQDEEKHKTKTQQNILVGHHYAQTKTDNVNKTRTTGGKDEPNVVFIRTSQRGTHEGLNFLLLKKTPVVLLIYTVQSDKNLGTYRGKKTSTVKSTRSIGI